MGTMRRGSSTVIAIVGDVSAELLALLDRPSNVAVLEPPATGAEGAREAFARAERLQATYAVVAADPLGSVASEWHKMWSPGTGHRFEERAGEAVTDWRRGRLELPDYYVVVVEKPHAPSSENHAEPHPNDFHLGVLRSQRPSRVAEVVAAQAAETAARTLSTLAELRQGPWWPGLDQLVTSIRSFFPGGLAAVGEGVSYAATFQDSLVRPDPIGRGPAPGDGAISSGEAGRVS